MVDFEEYRDIVYNIIGAAMEVHKTIGGGLLEPIYNESMCLELDMNGISNSREIELPCYYKGVKLEKTYRMDIVVNNDICIELKTVNNILPEHRMQLFNYLRLTRKPIGLLINFGQNGLSGERYGFDETTNTCLILDKEMHPLSHNPSYLYG